MVTLLKVAILGFAAFAALAGHEPEPKAERTCAVVTEVPEVRDVVARACGEHIRRVMFKGNSEEAIYLVEFNINLAGMTVSSDMANKSLDLARSVSRDINQAFPVETLGVLINDLAGHTLCAFVFESGRLVFGKCPEVVEP